MKKLALALFLAILVMLVAAFVANAQGANVIRNVGCNIWTGPYGYGSGVEVYDARIVVTYSKNGDAILTCKGKLPEGSPMPKRAVTFNYQNTGILCGVAGEGYTTQWHTTITPSGNATLTCHVSDKTVYQPPD